MDPTTYALLDTYRASERARCQAEARATLAGEEHARAQHAAAAHPSPATLSHAQHAQRAHARAQRQAETAQRARTRAQRAYLSAVRRGPDVAPSARPAGNRTADAQGEGEEPTREHARPGTPGGPDSARADGTRAPRSKFVGGFSSSSYRVLRSGVRERRVLRQGEGASAPVGGPHTSSRAPRRSGIVRPGDKRTRAGAPNVDRAAGGAR